MAWLWVSLGVALLGLTAVDVFRTVLAPSARGPVSYLIYRSLFRLARAAPHPLRRTATTLAGPLGIVASIVAWLILIWLGYGLFYLSLADQISVSPDSSPPAGSLTQALYFSGASITTAGFGDLVGDTTLVRFISVAEAATGLGIFTAAIGYLPAIYTVISELRTAARSITDLELQSADHAADMVIHGGAGAVDGVRRDVIGARQHLLRFPVLFYFRPPIDASPVELLRGAATLCLVLQWGVDHARVPFAALYGRGLQVALLALLGDLSGHVHPQDPDEQDSADLAAERIARVRAAVAALDPGLAPRGDVPSEAVDFVAHATAIIDAYAVLHDYD
jgi:hypothetical protein